MLNHDLSNHRYKTSLPTNKLIRQLPIILRIPGDAKLVYALMTQKTF